MLSFLFLLLMEAIKINSHAEFAAGEKKYYNGKKNQQAMIERVLSLS